MDKQNDSSARGVEVRKILSLEEHAKRIEQAILGLSHIEAQMVLIEFIKGKYGTRNRARLNQFAEIINMVKNVMGSPTPPPDSESVKP